jgi:hypothetical protein
LEFPSDLVTSGQPPATGQKVSRGQRSEDYIYLYDNQLANCIMLILRGLCISLFFETHTLATIGSIYKGEGADGFHGNLYDFS